MIPYMENQDALHPPFLNPVRPLPHQNFLLFFSLPLPPPPLLLSVMVSCCILFQYIINTFPQHQNPPRLVSQRETHQNSKPFCPIATFSAVHVQNGPPKARDGRRTYPALPPSAFKVSRSAKFEVRELWALSERVFLYLLQSQYSERSRILATRLKSQLISGLALKDANA